MAWCFLAHKRGAFVSAFPKSLHCTDEAQQAETVLSAVLSLLLLLLVLLLLLLGETKKIEIPGMAYLVSVQEGGFF